MCRALGRAARARGCRRSARVPRTVGRPECSFPRKLLIEPLASGGPGGV
jgi:hypothetical protein